jgi:hypothetical protein
MKPITATHTSTNPTRNTLPTLPTGRPSRRLRTNLRRALTGPGARETLALADHAAAAPSAAATADPASDPSATAANAASTAESINPDGAPA